MFAGNMEISVLNDGGLMMVCDKPLPSIVKRIEYYREQRMFMLIYYDNNKNLVSLDELLECEIADDMTHHVEQSPNMIIYSLFPDHEPIGYKAPLVKVGELN